MLVSGIGLPPRIGRLLVCIFLIGLALAPTSRAQTGAPTLDVLVDQVNALFPKVDGDVIEVQGSTVTLALGRKDGIVAGIEMALYREGRELRHPRTGVVLGRTEQTIGRLVIQQVFEAYSTGTVSQGGDVRPGDKARVSAGKVSLTLFTLVDAGVKPELAETAVRELVESLGRSGRFQIGMGDAINLWLKQEGIGRQELLDGKGLASVGTRFKVENLLVVVFSRVQGKPYMDVRLFAFPGPSALLTTALYVPPSIKVAPKGDFSASNRSRDSQSLNPPRSFLAKLLTGDLDAGTYSSGESSIPLKEVAKFPFVVVSMDIAVSSKDKLPRLVVTDGERIFLYRISGQTLEPEWTYRSDSRGRVFSVQLAELTGEGALNVVANRYNSNPMILLTSFILTSRDGKPALAVEDVSEILFAVDESGDGVKKTLWMQPFDQNGFFKKGDAVRASIKGNKLVPDTRARVPSTFRATGATFSNIAGKGARALAFVDDQNRLRITVDSEEVFRSAAPVGGGAMKLEVQTRIERGGRSYLYTPEPIPLAVDLDGDGVEELVMPQNQFPGRLAVVFKGPAGYRFQTVNSGFEGTVAAIGAVPGEGTPRLVVAVVRFTNMWNTMGETQIIMTTTE